MRRRSEPADAKDGVFRQRIMDAALSWAAVTGLRKMSMDEIARRAKVSRATLYKYFAGRDQLISAMVRDELAKFFADVQAVTDTYDDEDERLIHGFAHAYRLLSQHRVVLTVLRSNPELLLPYVIGRHSYALNLGRSFVESAMNVEGLPESVRTAFAEHLARAFHTLILIPSDVLGLDAPDGPENYARNFLVPVKNHLMDSDHVISARN